MNKYLTLLLIIALVNAEEKLVTSEFTSKVFNTDEVVGWVVSGNKGGKLVGQCSGESTFGGYDVFGQGAVANKSFNSQVSHYELVIRFELFAIDSWDDELFILKLDDEVVFTYSFQYNKQPPTGSRPINCGSQSWSDRLLQVDITVSHSSRKFNLQMTSTLNQDANDESWGIRNLQIIARYAGVNAIVLSEEFSDDNFNESYSGWVLSQPLIKPFSTCGNNKLFGGYNLFDNESWAIQNLVITALSGKGDKQTLIANEFSDNNFTSAPGWLNIANNADVSSKISNCGGSNIFGGYNQLSREDVYKVYKNVPLHTNVRIFFKLFAIDSWDNEAFRIFIDDVQVVPQVAPFQQTSKICGVSGWDDRIRNYFIDVPHVGSQLKLAFYSDLDENADNESYGIRDLKIWTYLGYHVKVVSSEFDDYSLWSVNGWSTKPDVNPKVSTCGPYQLFGGYNIFGSKTVVSKSYSDLPKHNRVIISFKLFFIDTWDKEDLYVIVDGVQIGKRTKSETWGGQQSLCGWNKAQEEIYSVQFATYHVDSKLTLQIGDKLNQGKDDESWGMRDLVVTVQNNVDAEEECVVIYSECDFKGKSFSVCKNIPDLSAVGWNDPIRSVSVPQGVRSRLFDEKNYQGNSVQALQNVSCLIGQAFVQLNQAFGIQVKESDINENKLKKQN
ncbi:hypothetical protein IMG5_122030 [Ichthyophthirius multifiliis]|uniref:Beta/gamma crystallin 'Greek key' domain-containing protein n=1 Tax=Ichthyophthirius multifiliis TaxID=5932 RepID=G0QV88_ICHMU|nr:hypothetical protein IMG5_122030 [Ichthyophthirius multifiliis]EGR30872.1 hypothetical protein IMG5_122030 [Ichthyophthirius multifiliis]|eukprot:XP_004032459.1 hypothetical protein IMG5_122030 [Ichthyophthirius multifiliis]